MNKLFIILTITLCIFSTFAADSDGKGDFAVWYILNAENSPISYQSFGASGDKPIASAFVQ